MSNDTETNDELLHRLDRMEARDSPLMARARSLREKFNLYFPDGEEERFDVDLTLELQKCANERAVAGNASAPVGEDWKTSLPLRCPHWNEAGTVCASCFKAALRETQLTHTDLEELLAGYDSGYVPRTTVLTRINEMLRIRAAIAERDAHVKVGEKRQEENE